jgi:uncharacterized protein
MKHLDDLVEWFDEKSRTMVALSGGVDSALVAYAAYKKLGGMALAVTADYKTLPRDELADARRVCSEIGMRHVILEYDELENEDFVRNDSSRCFHCRMDLGTRLNGLARQHDVTTIVDGTHADDMGEYRPGIAALRQNGIMSPLAILGISKPQIRRAAEYVGLSVHDKPSNACLASRIPWGQRVTAERLARIEFGESIIRQMTPARQVRVRDLDGSAVIEVEKSMVPAFQGKTLRRITERLMMIGFTRVEVDPDGYVSGKINVIAD